MVKLGIKKIQNRLQKGHSKMTTTLYFIRHTQPDFSIHDEQKRP